LGRTVQRQDDRCRASRFFSVRVRRFREDRVHRCVRESGARCIRRGSRRRVLVRSAWGRVRRLRLRDRRVREAVRVGLRVAQDNDTFHVA